METAAVMENEKTAKILYGGGDGLALGILALAGQHPVVLVLSGMLALVISMLICGPAVSGGMLRLFHG